MKEKQVINKLRLLKTIQPTQSVLKEMKQGIYQQVKMENKVRSINFQGVLGNIALFVKEYIAAFYGIAFALLLIIFVSASSILFPNQSHTVILYGKLTLASNQYQKASIALSDTTYRFEKNKPTTQNSLVLSQSLALVNEQLNNLKLKGEKGKYTTQQCHQIYQEYLDYLKREEKNISGENTRSLSYIKSQISTYEEQAEKKLHMYTSL